jgi:hypothetical protein
MIAMTMIARTMPMMMFSAMLPSPFYRPVSAAPSWEVWSARPGAPAA